VLLLAPALARSAGALPKDMRLLDPWGKMSADWVLPEGHGQDCRLLVDPKGKPWLLCRQLYLMGPDYAAFLAADRPLQGLAWLGNGALLGVSGDELGLLSPAQGAAGRRAAGRLPFGSLGRWPGRALALFSGDGDAAYLVASGPQGSEVFLLAGGERGLTKTSLLKTSKRITAVAGDGERTFVAFGRRVFGLGRRKAADRRASYEVQRLFESPDADVTSLGYSRGTGLFYATARGAGFLGSRYRLDFLSARGAQAQLSGGALYVLPAGGGVLKLGGLDRFTRTDAELARAGLPVDLELSREAAHD
jgi:hypothetical protein